MARAKQKTSAEKEELQVKRALRKAERSVKAERISAFQSIPRPSQSATKSPEALALEKKLSKWEATIRSSESMKKHGVRLQRASDIVSPHLRRVSSGVMSMDLKIGGGFPCGGIVTVSGPPGTGKTFLCLQAAGQVQQAYGDSSCIFFATNEAVVPKDHARLAGFYIRYSEEEIRQKEEARSKLGLPPFSPEELEDLRYQVGEVEQVTSITAEGTLGVIREAIDSGIFQLIILDSMNNLIPEEEDKAEIGERTTPARKAFLLTQFSGQIPNALMQPTIDGDVNYTCMLVTKQVRANIGGFSMSPTKESLGAWSLEHNRLIGVELHSTDKLTEKGDGKSKWTSDFYGKKIGWYINKGKSGCHEGGNGEFKYYYDSGIDTANDLFICGMSYGVIRQDEAKEEGGKPSSYLNVLNQSGVVIARANGQKQVEDLFRNDPGLVDDVRRAILVRAGIECLHR